MDCSANMNTDLPHLHELGKAAARSAMGRVAAAWPLIGTSLASGKKLCEIWEAAEQDGLGVSYPLFKLCVHRLRKRERRRAVPAGYRAAAGQTVPSPRSPQREPAPQADPLRNLREQRGNTKSFEYDPFPRKGLTQ